MAHLEPIPEKSQLDASLEDPEPILTPDELLVLKKFVGFLKGGEDFPGINRFFEFFRSGADGTDESFTESDKLSLTASEEEAINDPSEYFQATLDDGKIATANPGIQVITHTNSPETNCGGPSSATRYSVIDGGNGGYVVNHSYLERYPVQTAVQSAAFFGATITGGTGTVRINNHSFNGNSNCHIVSGGTHDRAFNAHTNLYQG